MFNILTFTIKWGFTRSASPVCEGGVGGGTSNEYPQQMFCEEIGKVSCEHPSDLEVRILKDFTKQISLVLYCCPFQGEWIF